MTDLNNSGSDGPRLNRRRTLQVLGAGVGAVAGLGTFAGSAAAWEREPVDVDFKGCSSVWIVVDPVDIKLDPPAVARIIVETEDGEAVCRDVEFTEDTTAPIPGQHGDAPVLKYSASPDKKILGVIIYNYIDDEDDPFSREIPSPLVLNPNRCANTPGTPEPTEASCADNTYSTEDKHIIESRGASGDTGRGNGHGNDDDNGKDDDDNGKGRGNGNGRGNGR